MVKEPNAWLLPIAPLTKMSPPVPALSMMLGVTPVVPLTVLWKVMFAPVANVWLSVVSNEVLVDSSTSVLNTIELALWVRTEPPLNVVVPLPVVSTCNGAVVLPMAPRKSVLPLSSKMRRRAPSTLDLN